MSVDTEILHKEAELRQAQLDSDAAALDRLLDDRLIFTSFDGTIATKDDDLSLHRSGRLRITRMEPIECSMLHLGETSVVSVKMNAAATLDGTEMTSVLRYTRVWHKRNDDWRIVAGHMSTVP